MESCLLYDNFSVPEVFLALIEFDLRSLRPFVKSWLQKTTKEACTDEDSAYEVFTCIMALHSRSNHEMRQKAFEEQCSQCTKEMGECAAANCAARGAIQNCGYGLKGNQVLMHNFGAELTKCRDVATMNKCKLPKMFQVGPGGRGGRGSGSGSGSGERRGAGDGERLGGGNGGEG